jgi:hypothetical protein
MTFGPLTFRTSEFGPAAYRPVAVGLIAHFQRRSRMTRIRATSVALAVAALVATVHGQNPIVGGKEMLPTRNIIENAMN